VIKKFLQKIFKVISYGIFFKIYGKVEKSIDSSEDDRIKVEIINIDKNLKYRVYNIDSGRLYTDRVHDTAVLVDNKIIEGPSFQLRQTRDLRIYNSKIRENIVFTKGTPRKLRNLNGSILSLLTGGGGNNNYWHWLFDVLPRLALCSKIISLIELDYFLLPAHTKKFQIESLDHLNIPKNKRLSSEKFRHIKARKLIVTDHPVVTSGDATKDIMNIPKWISQWLKENFLPQNITYNKKDIKKIYIDRSDNISDRLPKRIISNEEEVKKYLLKNNFIPIRLHETDFIEQVKLFNNAEYIVGLHGGGFANLAFCKPGTRVIELKGITAGTPIENLAKKNDLNYSSIAVEAKQIEKYNFPNQQGSIQVPISNLIKELEG
jgi:capsular polysaccharide biosynthesis protein